MVIHLSEIIENDSERRKSSISFGANLEYPDPGDNPVYDGEKAKDDNEAFKNISYFFPSEARPSIFSRISEKSFPDLLISYKYFFLCCSILIIFIMGVLVGTLATKYLLCQGFEQEKEINIIKVTLHFISLFLGSGPFSSQLWYSTSSEWIEVNYLNKFVIQMNSYLNIYMLNS